MKTSFVVALVLALIAGSPALPSDAKQMRKKPSAIRGGGRRTMKCPSDARSIRKGDDPQAVINSAGRGASLCFKPGTYRLRGPLWPRAGQVLTFERGAVLSGAKVARGWKKEGTNWVLEGQTQSFTVPSWMHETMCDNNPGACIYEDVFRDDRPLKHVTSRDKLRPGRVYFDKNADKIYIANDPRGHTMEVTVAERAIQSAAGGVTIRGATIEKYADTGIFILDANNWTISHSDIRDVHFQGIGVHKGTGHMIQNTRVRHNGVIGMSGSELRNLTVRRSEFGHNNYLHAGPVAGGYHEGSVKILQSHDVVFQDNHSHHNYGDGLWFDGNHDILIENNLLEHNTRHGLQYEISFDATVRYNTIRNNGRVGAAQGAGILNSTSKNVDYYGNRIASNAIRSIVIMWRDRGWNPRFGEHQSANLSFRNNVIKFDNNFQSWVGVYWDQDRRVYSSNNRFEGNTYISPKNAERKGKLWWRWDGKDLTWAQWRADGFDNKGSFHESRVGHKKGDKKQDSNQGGKKHDDKTQGKKVKEKKKKKPAPDPVSSRLQMFLRDADGCDSNKNSLSVRNGPDKGCRNFNQEPAQIWSVIDGNRFKLDVSRPITGEVSTAGGDCVSDASCLAAGLGVGEAQVDIIVLGTIGGRERNLGTHTETFFIAPSGIHTSKVSIDLNPALSNVSVRKLKVLTRLHGTAIGHDVVVLDDPASFIKVPTLVAR